ncbi:MAG TPA: hypothetical protein VHR72_01595 [Gemmataceae bacterium]|jgi:hypothetical protein|nr:hypothetical protein [Gemmataceae bacterium]
MMLTNAELAYLSAWANEEQQPACYGLPAHRMQLAHGLSGAQMITLIKAWTEAEGKKDHEILDVDADMPPHWPWTSIEDQRNRVSEAAAALGAISTS